MTITVLRLSSLGDVAMLVPVFLSFHASYPEYKLRLISRGRFQPIFADLDFVEFLAIDEHKNNLSFLELIRFSIQLSRYKDNIILDMHDVIRTKIIRTISSWTSSKIAIIDKGRTEKNELIAKNGDKSKWLKSNFERYQEVFKKIGLTFELQALFLTRKTKSNQKVFIGISPFAKHKSKEYNYDKMQGLINLLAVQNDFQIYIFGYGAKEREEAMKMAGSHRNVEVTIGQYSFQDELKLIANLDIMLSMDSGNGHLAANYGIPVVTLWGTTHPKLGFAPYFQPLYHSIFPDSTLFPDVPVSVYGKCNDEHYLHALHSIKIEEIYYKILKVLNKTAKSKL